MPTGGEGSAAMVLPDALFENLDHEQREEFMKQKVVPAMKPLFVNRDPKEDLEWMEKEIAPTMAKILNQPLASKDNPTGFGCLTCHTVDGQ